MLDDLDITYAMLEALYAFTLNGDGFDALTADRMGQTPQAFGWSLYVMQLRGWIAGCKFQPPAPGSPDKLMGVIRSGLTLTEAGFKEAEALARERQPEHGRSIKRLTEGAWLILKDIGCGIMANYVSRWIG